jgi:hypothetical protein
MNHASQFARKLCGKIALMNFVGIELIEGGGVVSAGGFTAGAARGGIKTQGKTVRGGGRVYPKPGKSRAGVGFSQAS